MFTFICSLILMTVSVISFSSWSQEDSDYSFSEPVLVKAYTNNEIGQTVRSVLTSSPEFNYYEGQSLGASSSIFLYGLDQRYSELYYEGHKLTDPSTPLGVIEGATLSRLSHINVRQGKNSRHIFLENKSDKNFVKIGGSSLKEVQGDFFYKQEGFSIKGGGSRLGGYNQTDLGDERDWTEEAFLSPQMTYTVKGLKMKSLGLWTHQLQDYDSYLSGNEMSEGRSSFFLFGHTMKNDRFETRFTYTNINKNYDEGGGIPSYDLESESMRSELRLGKHFSFEHLFETNSEIQDQIWKITYKNKKVKFDYRQSRLRGDLYNFEYYWNKNWKFYYSEIPISLFQRDYNESRLNIDKQKSVGLNSHYAKTWKDLNFDFEILYQRAWDQIEYFAAEDAYRSIAEVENIFFSTLIERKGMYFLTQFQRAKNLVSNQDLPRRPGTVFGLGYEKKIYDMSLSADVKWHSSRSAFDQTRLSPFWSTELELKRKGFQIVVFNVLNQDSEIFKNFQRRPFVVELNYLYKF